MQNVNLVNWNEAEAKLIEHVATMPVGAEMQLSQIIGKSAWEPLEDPERHAFGRHVRANPSRFGLVYAGTLGTIAIYRRFSFANTDAWKQAEKALLANVQKMPLGAAMTVRKIVGEAAWQPLDRKQRNDFGRHVRARQAAFGLVYAGKKGTVAIYRRLVVLDHHAA